MPPQERATWDATTATVRRALSDTEFYAARARGETLVTALPGHAG